MTPLGNASDRLGVRRPPCLRPTFRERWEGSEGAGRSRHRRGGHAALRFQTPV